MNPRTGEMRGSQEAVIHQASSFVAPGDKNHNTGPYLAHSLPKHTWRHMARAYIYIHTHTQTRRDNNTTAKHDNECNLTTAAAEETDAFDYFFLGCVFITLTRVKSQNTSVDRTERG